MTGERSRSEVYVAAGEVCGGALSGATEELISITRSEDFEHLLLAGEPSDVPALVDALQVTDSRELGFCRLLTPASQPHRFLEFFFGWVERQSVDSNDSALRDDPVNLFYDTGEEAVTLGRGAAIYFPCSVEGRAEESVSVRLGVGIQDAGEPDDRITLLNSLARSVAERLGCLEESALTDGVPQRLER
ncbi:hypothetical protein [Streptomyces marincola]|uniref:hypothetical protein n=1 Tax=Streptomyces marincola TaxID=2878388 RepID=UPI001CF14DEC|nr:hypothetical protein [Streptomyces marincola]UCM90577.1 hypothetical protein LC193_23025 [Streptomyces marincola]